MGLFRLMLAVAVLFAHASSGLRMLKGGLCVNVFFVISGFYMALILTQKYDGPAHLQAFYANRILRIYPTYLFILAMAIGYYYFCYFATNGKTPAPILFDVSAHLHLWQIFAMWMANIFLFGHDLMHCMCWSPDLGFQFLAYKDVIHPPGVYWLGDATWVTPAWSLGVELIFYGMAPFIFNKKLPLLSFLAGLSLFAFWYLNRFTVGGAYFFSISSMWMFILGIFAFRFYQKAKALFPRIPKVFNMLLYFSPVLWVVLLPACFKDSLGLTVVLILTACTIPVLFHISKQSRLDRFIGNLSYPLYVSHELSLNMAKNFSNHFKLEAGVQSGLEIGVSLLFAVILYLAIDHNFEPLRSKNVPRDPKAI